MAWLGAIASMYATSQASRAANQGTNTSGNSQTIDDPWAPTTGMRVAGLNRLYDLFGGQWQQPTQNPNGSTTLGGPTGVLGGYVGEPGATMQSGVGGTVMSGSGVPGLPNRQFDGYHPGSQVNGGPGYGAFNPTGDPTTTPRWDNGFGGADGDGWGGGGAGPSGPVGADGNPMFRQAGGGPRPRGPAGGGAGMGGTQNPLGPRPGRGGGQSPGGGPGAGGGNAGGFNGQSAMTADLIQRLSDRAAQGHQLYDPANQAAQGLLAGDDPNFYREAAFDVMGDMGTQGADSDPYLQRFINDQFAAMGGGPGGGSGGGGGGGGFSMSFGPGATGNQVGVARDIREVLDGKFLGEENPYLQKMIDRASRDTRRQFMEEKIPGINDQFGGSGMFGSSMYQNALGTAGAGYAQSLADQEAALRFQDYERGMSQYDNALGLGTQYDMNAADNASQMASAASSAGASYAASQSAAENARRGQLLDAIGMGVNLRQGGAQGMAGLSGDYSQDYMGALSLVPELSGLDLRDLNAAGGLSLGSDQARNDFIGNQNSLRAAQMGAGSQRAQLQWDKYKYNREAPMSDLAAYAALINQFGQGGGTSQTISTGSQR